MLGSEANQRGGLGGLRISHLTGTISRLAGGPYESVRRLAQEQAFLDGDVGVATLRDARTDEDLKEWLPLRPRVFDAATPRSFGYTRGWRRYLDEAQPQLVHVHGLWMAQGPVTAEWARRTGRPYVVSPRGMLEPWALRYRGWKKKLVLWAWERRVLEEAACLHATSEEEAAQFRALGLRGRIDVIPNGVDVPRFGRREIAATGPRTALFLSRVHPKKGLPMLLNAWVTVRPTDWRLVIAGPDECGHTGALRKLAGELGLGERVDFVGPVYGSEKQRLFDEADLFVLPTYSENFGIAVAEALASGVPVLTTTGAPWKMLLEEDCGWWVEPSVEGVTAGLRAATLTPVERLQEMGARGRRAVEQRLGWRQIAARMMRVYEECLGR